MTVTSKDTKTPAGLAAIVAEPGGDPAEQWIAKHREELDDLLLRHGSVLVTGLAMRTATTLRAVRSALGRPEAPSLEFFAPRRAYGGGVYSWPGWDADREMCLHHEQSYGADHPRLLVLACVTRAEAGGAVLVGDTRALIEHLPARLVDRFRDEGWTFVRNFMPRLGMAWTEVFGTRDRALVEERCAKSDLACTWLPGGALTLRQSRPALSRHPDTSEECWFNDVAFMSQWSLAKPERDVLLAAFGPEGMPYNTCFGSGEALSEQDYAAISAAYEQVATRVPWQSGDLLLLDNMLSAHGRDAYVGDWNVLTALAGPPAAT